MKSVVFFTYFVNGHGFLHNCLNIPFTKWWRSGKYTELTLKYCISLFMHSSEPGKLRQKIR